MALKSLEKCDKIGLKYLEKCDFIPNFDGKFHFIC